MVFAHFIVYFYECFLNYFLMNALAIRTIFFPMFTRFNAMPYCFLVFGATIPRTTPCKPLTESTLYFTAKSILPAILLPTSIFFIDVSFRSYIFCLYKCLLVLFAMFATSLYISKYFSGGAGLISNPKTKSRIRADFVNPLNFCCFRILLYSFSLT